MAPEVAHAVTLVTTIQHHLPQGSPTSPIIAAIAMLNLGRRLDTLVRAIRGTVTVYGDNLSISANVDLGRYERTIERIVRSEGFRLRRTKTVLSPPGADKSLPGVLVRDGRITVHDNDLADAQRGVGECASLGPGRLSHRVCRRYRTKMAGVLNQLAWIDPVRAAPVLARFETLLWPAEYSRQPCVSPHCHCQVSESGVPFATSLLGPNVQKDEDTLLGCGPLESVESGIIS
jgi:hypothetical protein